MTIGECEERIRDSEKELLLAQLAVHKWEERVLFYVRLFGELKDAQYEEDQANREAISYNGD